MMNMNASFVPRSHFIFHIWFIQTAENVAGERLRCFYAHSLFEYNYYKVTFTGDFNFSTISYFLIHIHITWQPKQPKTKLLVYFRFNLRMFNYDLFLVFLFGIDNIIIMEMFMHV